MQTDYGAFVQKIVVKPPTSNSATARPLTGLTFAVKDIFDLEGYVTGFGNPDWARTHPTATITAPAVLSCLSAGATCIGKTVMDELAYSINGENKHYGTPRNPCNPTRVPGGSSSGSAVSVGAGLVDFSLGTDTGGSVRVPASHCGILGFRPSHGAVSTDGVIPMAQSFDTVGWFARDSKILKQIGDVLIQSQTPSSQSKPTQIIIADDCFNLSCFPTNLQTETLIESVTQIFGGDVLKNINLGQYIKQHVPSLKFFADTKNEEQSLSCLSSAMRTHQRYEFKKNHGEWVLHVKPDVGTGISERVREAIEATDEHVFEFENVKRELYDALGSLLGVNGVLAIPTLPGDPPKVNMDSNSLIGYREKAFSLLSVAGVSGFCQVSIPVGMYGDVAVDISLLAKHGSDRFLLSVVESLHENLRQHFSEIRRLL